MEGGGETQKEGKKWEGEAWRCFMGYLEAHVSKLLSFQVIHCVMCGCTHLTLPQKPLQDVQVISEHLNNYVWVPGLCLLIKPWRVTTCLGSSHCSAQLRDSRELSVLLDLSGLSSGSSSTDQYWLTCLQGPTVAFWRVFWHRKKLCDSYSDIWYSYWNIGIQCTFTPDHIRLQPDLHI